MAKKKLNGSQLGLIESIKNGAFKESIAFIEITRKGNRFGFYVHRQYLDKDTPSPKIPLIDYGGEKTKADLVDLVWFWGPAATALELNKLNQYRKDGWYGKSLKETINWFKKNKEEHEKS